MGYWADHIARLAHFYKIIMGNVTPYSPKILLAYLDQGQQKHCLRL